MTGQEIFSAWTPDNSLWSEWAKPVLFSFMTDVHLLTSPQPAPINMDGLPPADGSTLIIIDLPGAESVEVGAQLIDKRYQPVPLFNSCKGNNPVISVDPIIEALKISAEKIRRAGFSGQSAPAFLIDSNRLPKLFRLSPGMFDNRWIVLPQDFPSANLLLSKNFKRVIVIAKNDSDVPADDLNHVLRRWQQAGLNCFRFTLQSQRLNPYSVPRPPLFRWFVATALALAGLRANSAGGFGGVIPQPSRSHSRSYRSYG